MKKILVRNSLLVGSLMVILYVGYVFEVLPASDKFNRKQSYRSIVGVSGQTISKKPVIPADMGADKVDSGADAANNRDIGYNTSEELVARFFDLEDDWLAGDNFAPFNPSPTSKANGFRSSFLDVHGARTSNTEFDFDRQNHNGNPHVFAGDFYVGMLAAFNQLKYLDNFIQASWAEYRFDKFFLLGADPYSTEMKRADDRSFSDEEIEAALMASGQQNVKTDVMDLRFFKIFRLIGFDHLLYGLVIVFLCRAVYNILSYKEK